MRQLKHHEAKLLKKVDFLSWKSDAGMREVKVMRRYHVQNRDDYHSYNKICGQVRRLSHLLSRLPPADPFRAKYEHMLLSKLYDMGILDRGAKMSDIEGSDAPVVKGFDGKIKEVEGQGKKEGKVTVGALCRRRLAVVLVRLKMAETVKLVSGFLFSYPLICLLTLLVCDAVQAVTYIEQGHVRVGPDPITDPAFLVTRNMEDFVTWVDTSKLKRHVQKYNDELDDFDLMA
ncbi:BZ3500_MvSof-1268-A1-R1_Chr7-3g09618 [Microbotryum saponariae]|uniref:U3 small nucleolar ribonucleoprotein protein IMP3 n=1 Tax=Microbotryum saponariae TaxID=289078 RepID=A0A2X0L9P1_9BASI|nr:BZ3501_MvSof-1269-A2-R1_Chr7-2g09341 [Microbotryum saponariae]SDA02289.1 BZ3500_MvSof-1268-A1-R1_Chr7-3g09618 [Microbotryum saponariae]